MCVHNSTTKPRPHNQTHSIIYKYSSLSLPKGILQDLFPGIDLPEHDYGDLQAFIEDGARNKNLQVVPSQISKVIQLYETMLVRHGVMLVGPTGGGKTTCYEVRGRGWSCMYKYV